MEDHEHGEGEISTVEVQLLTFWPSQLPIWFRHAEAYCSCWFGSDMLRHIAAVGLVQKADAQFQIRRVTDDTIMYYYIVAALDQATAGRLLDILTDDGKYKVQHSTSLIHFAENRARLLS